ncbi:glycosyl transferase family 1 [Flavobacteriaceae bacterium MAR_2010_105]|nr:glycosyl transferase family 1 [Flavobacteriaceae bacterium MAR_2010_105]
MTLAIISHTEHYTLPDGTLVGWSPTVNEINHLLDLFDRIYHVAMHYEGEAPKSVMAYASDRIQFVPIPAVGGKRISDKLSIVYQAPKIISIVSKVLKQVDCFQLRTPTGIGVFLIPYLSGLVNLPGWYKYAGNWKQESAPLGYAWQRWLLKGQKRPVTINGVWEDQPAHCLSFENPCLTSEDLAFGKAAGESKSLDGPLTLCFVGRLETEKGVGRILEALKLLNDTEHSRIGTMHFVGAGPAMAEFKAKAEGITIPIVFHGALSRVEVFDIYNESHAFLLPTSASEGFPKVLAEAMAFGCIPVVSKLSSIGQYITHHEQGLLLDEVNAKALAIQLGDLMAMPPKHYRRMLTLQQELVHRFTFEQYNRQLNQDILTQFKV